MTYCITDWEYCEKYHVCYIVSFSLSMNLKTVRNCREFAEGVTQWWCMCLPHMMPWVQLLKLLSKKQGWRREVESTFQMWVYISQSAWWECSLSPTHHYSPQSSYLLCWNNVAVCEVYANTLQLVWIHQNVLSFVWGCIYHETLSCFTEPMVAPQERMGTRERERYLIKYV